MHLVQGVNLWSDATGHFCYEGKEGLIELLLRDGVVGRDIRQYIALGLRPTLDGFPDQVDQFNGIHITSPACRDRSTYRA